MGKGMRALFAIVDQSRGEELAAVYREARIPVSISLHGFGLADSAILELLGFGENRKAIFISLLAPARVADACAAVEARMGISSTPGRGIMFSVPVTAATAFLSGLTEKDEAANRSEAKEITMINEHEYDLVITIISKGFLSEVKAAAKEAGARGGTMVHALGLGAEEAQRFLGISIQPEKDIVLNVVRREEKAAVMRAIAEVAGINTEGRGIIFSLPVDCVIGLNKQAPAAAAAAPADTDTPVQEPAAAE